VSYYTHRFLLVLLHCVWFFSASLISSYFCLSVRSFLFFLAGWAAMVEFEAGHMHSCSCYSFSRQLLLICQAAAVAFPTLAHSTVDVHEVRPWLVRYLLTTVTAMKCLLSYKATTHTRTCGIWVLVKFWGWERSQTILTIAMLLLWWSRAIRL